MMKQVYSLLLLILLSHTILAQSEPSTYFNIYVPPNNEAVKRNVALIVTAVSDSTSFTITDDDLDGDSDDNVSGMLMSGQSYILYIKDNGINDDAMYASGGTLARNGDYYIIQSNKLVYASMSSDSDWQHDYVPAVNKKSVGQKFYVYAPKVSSSPRDLNVFAYKEETTISIYKISTVPTTQSGYTNINLTAKQLVVQKTLQPGQDIIHYAPEGRNVMETGGTYLIESNKDISVQYGALWDNARDGGAYVPSANGSGSGELFYFAVPYQANGEQEIRIVSWDDANEVQLSRYSNGNWVTMNNWLLDELQPADWVGKQNGNATYPTVFKVSCSPGKRISVMEANWMETGSTNTSDMSTMLSSETGTSSGKRFLAYMLPPSTQSNVVNPFTGELFTGSISHFYLFAGNKNTTVTIKDAKTNGQVLNETYQIEAGRYADASFNMDEWKSIYNGTGTPSGAERPYVVIESTEHISVLSTNFNDNWMSYFGSSLPQSFTQIGSISNTVSSPGKEETLSSVIDVGDNQQVQDASVEVKISSGLIPLESKITNNGQVTYVGNIQTSELGSVVTFDPIPVISSNDNYQIETKVIVASTYNDGSTIPSEAVLSMETIVSGTVDGEFQQSYFTQGIQNNAENTSNLLYSACQLSTNVSASNNSWNPSWVDYDNDGHEDLFIATKDATTNNELYRNNGNGTFTKITNHPLVNEKANTVAAVWADINNNGRKDVFLVNATQHPSKLFINHGAGSFSALNNSGIDTNPQYFHGAAFADFDNDGFVDLIVTNFFPTRFHHLYRNNGDNSFTAVTNTSITSESERAMAPILADYDNDGLVDVFIPNGNNRPNSLFKNMGNFQFEKVNDPALLLDRNNSVGASWGDFDNDGFPDLLVVNASGQNNDLYRNNGDGTFDKLDDSLLSLQGGDSHGVAWYDLNNDGWLDAYVTNDMGPSFLYINDGQGGFRRKRDEVISGNTGNAYGVAVGDYNKDGQLDLSIATHTQGANPFFCHNGSISNWIGFQLQGVYSNKQALGARLAIKSDGVWQYRQNLPLSGFGSQRTANIHFGLGETASVDSIIVLWPSGIRQQVTNFNVNQYNMVLEEAGNMVKGTVFHDLNKNGSWDEAEPLLSNIRLNINHGNIHLATNEEGRFEFRTNDRQFVFDLDQQNWELPQQHSQYQFATGANEINIMLPVHAVQFGYDLSINLATTAWRRGFTNETTMQVSNLGTEPAENATVSLTLPDEAYLISTDMSYSTPSSKTYVWELGTINPGMIKTIQVMDSIGLEASTGQVLLINASAEALGEDLDNTNNNLLDEVEVVGAIDPNDMLVHPRGEGPQGYIFPDQWLTYTIRFENVGTYQATYVFLENQLPEALDIASFQIISSSHDYSYTLTEHGKLEVAYRYIDLPTAADDSIGAHGYFKYRIRPAKGITGGTQIANHAKIYFDFEEPIATNTVMNTLKYQGSNEVKHLKIFPNPADDWVDIILDESFFNVTDPKVVARWVIRDYNSARIVCQGRGNFEAKARVSVGHLTTGMYLLSVFDQSGDEYIGKMIKR